LQYPQNNTIISILNKLAHSKIQEVLIMMMIMMMMMMMIYNTH